MLRANGLHKYLIGNNLSTFCGRPLRTRKIQPSYSKELRLGRLIFPIRVVERLRQTKGLTPGGNASLESEVKRWSIAEIRSGTRSIQTEP